MCTSLDCGSQWWPSGPGGASSACQSGEAALRGLVEQLRSQLCGSQALVCGLQAQLGSSRTRSPPPAPGLSWRLEAPPQSAEDPDGGWRGLASRVDALEDQLRNGGRKPGGEDRLCPPAWPG